MTQDHSAFPHITKLVVQMIHDAGGIHIYRPETKILELLDECLGADGVTFEALQPLDEWVSRLTDDEFGTASSGEESEMSAIMATAPGLSDDDSDTAAVWFNQVYEHCIWDLREEPPR